MDRTKSRKNPRQRTLSFFGRQKVEYTLVTRQKARSRLEYWKRNRVLLLVSTPILLATFLMRFWNLGFAPQLRTDELAENAVGSAIALGTLHEPVLLNINDFASSLYNHLAALSFALLGLNPVSPFYLIVFASTFAVFVVMIMGKRMFNSLIAGVIAGLLLAFSFYAIVETSHRAWSISLTPFFAATATFLLYQSLQSKSLAQLFAAMFITGLAIQTHPVAIILPFAFAGFAIWSKGHRWLSAKKHLPLAILGLVLGILPLILAPYVASTNPISAVSHSDWTGLYRGLSFAKYSNMLIQLFLAFGMVVSPVWYGFSNPVWSISLVLFWAGILVAIIRRNTADKLILTQFLAFFLIVPAGIAVPAPRYIAFMLPMAYIAITSAFMVFVDGKWLARLRKSRKFRHIRTIFSAKGLRVFVVGMIIIFALIIPSFLTVQAFYKTALKGYETNRDASTNVGYMQALSAIGTERPYLVVLDANSSNFRPCCYNGVIRELLKEMNYKVAVPYSAQPMSYYSHFKNVLRSGTIVFVFDRVRGQMNQYESTFLEVFPGQAEVQTDNIGRDQQIVLYAVTTSATP